MTDYQFRLCVSEAAEYNDMDTYVSDMALSSIWGDDPDDDIPQERLDHLAGIYSAVHMDVKGIANRAGLSQRKLAERFCVPYRTMEDWCSGRRECCIYIRLMMHECLGLLHR